MFAAEQVAERGVELEHLDAEGVPDRVEGAPVSVRNLPVSDELGEDRIAAKEFHAVGRMERGVETFPVGWTQACEHAAHDEFAARLGLVRAGDHVVHAGVPADADDVAVELGDGLVDRHPLRPRGKALEGVRRLLPGGLDDPADESVGERLAVQGVKQVPAMPEKLGVVRGELAQLGEVGREGGYVRADGCFGAQLRVSADEDPVEVLEDVGAQLGVVAARAERGGDERVGLPRLVAGLRVGTRRVGARLRREVGLRRGERGGGDAVVDRA